MNNFNGNNDEMIIQDKNTQVTSENFESSYEEIYNKIEDLIFLYKTPRIYHLIFQ